MTSSIRQSRVVDDPLAVGLGYDKEGTTRQRLVLVDRGTTMSLTHDRRSAAEAASTSTGHAVDMAFWWGPVARHLGLLPAGDEGDVAGEVDGPIADSSVAELVAGVGRGVLVSDFWYTRMLDPRTLAITGLTRNGVWLIEDGEVTRPLHNFRFTQSYAQALMPGNVKAVGRDCDTGAGRHVHARPRHVGHAPRSTSRRGTSRVAPRADGSDTLVIAGVLRRAG